MLPPPSDSAWITPYGVILGLGLLMAWWYARRRAVASGTDPSHIDLMVPLIFLISILGAWLLPILSPGDTLLMDNTGKSQIRFRLFGLLFVATPAIFVYCRIAGLGCRRILDLFALPAVLWLVCLRIGCFLAGCCWGDVAIKLGAAKSLLAAQVQTVPWLTGDWVWSAVVFPQSSLAYQQHIILNLIGTDATESMPVHPTQLYELAYLLVFWVILRTMESRTLPPGYLAIATLAGYTLGRFVIEFLRADSGISLGNLTFTQLLCAMLFAGCAFAFGKMKTVNGSLYRI